MTDIDEIDIDELEWLARAANPTGTWGRMRACVTLNGRIVFGCEPVSDQGGHTKAVKFAKFFSAANPAAVLELIERLRATEAETFAAQQALITEGMERDRLAAQNAELSAALERIARHPATRADELSAESMRGIARTAITKQQKA